MKVLVFGTFDHLHPGHRFLLSEASKRACPPEPAASTELSTRSRRRRGELWVVVARDANVKKIKGHDPDQDEHERLQAIQKTFPNSRPILGDPHDFLVPVRTIKPDLILLGYDQMLPPGVLESDLPCPIERIPAFEPEKWKSSFQRKHKSLKKHE